MKTKKYLIAMAIFGGVLFTVEATNIIDLNEQQNTEITKKVRKKPSAL